MILRCRLRPGNARTSRANLYCGRSSIVGSASPGGALAGGAGAAGAAALALSWLGAGVTSAGNSPCGVGVRSCAAGAVCAFCSSAGAGAGACVSLFGGAPGVGGGGAWEAGASVVLSGDSRLTFSLVSGAGASNAGFSSNGFGGGLGLSSACFGFGGGGGGGGGSMTTSTGISCTAVGIEGGQSS